MRGWRLARRPGLGPGGVVSQGPPRPSPRLGRPPMGSAPAAEARSHLLVPGESALGGAPSGPQTTTRPSQDPRSGPRLFPKPAEAQSPHTTAPPPEGKATLQHRTARVSARAPVFVGRAAAAGPAHSVPARSHYTGADCAGPAAKTPEPAGVSQARPHRAFTHARSSTFRGRPVRASSHLRRSLRGTFFVG